MNITKKTRIVSADEDPFLDDPGEDNFDDTLDDMAENIEDMQDTLDDIEEDDIDIDSDNNIENHYIAECERCKGIFISAIVESEQEIKKVSGICPLCEEETDQYLKWLVRPVDE